MKKFEGILLCTDLDGTLLRDDKTISKENLDAIEYFKSEGGYFTFVTGRMPYFVRDIYEAIKPNCPFGCINGGGVYDHVKQEYVWTQVMPEDVLELVEYADKNVPGIGIHISMFDKIYFCRENEAMANFRKFTKVPNIVLDYKDIKEPMAKVVFADEDMQSLALLEKVLKSHPRADEFDFIRSERTIYEILPKGISKGTVISKLTQILGTDMNKTIAVGDYNNDIAMIQCAKVGVAVANACEDAKNAADYITVSNEQHAIAAIVSDIESGKLKI